MALILALVLMSSLGLPGIAMAADGEPEGAPAEASAPESGMSLNTAHGETFYATLDYYGGILDSSVVKSYKTYGNDTITDYGVYDEIINLTDDLTPTVQDGTVTFSLAEDAPSQFYFEGKTKKPLEEFPWTLSLSYRLNGEPALAENLVGEKDVVEIILDAVPNLSASEYSRNNVVLTAMSTFNGDDITSLEAEGAQIQQVGNLYCVMFMFMPGEEQHFTIRVGSNDFTYGGMMFLAVPATFEQLDQIADLREAKEKTEDSYDAVQDSMDAILDALEGMSGDISATANGMERINSGRETLSNGKDTIYGDTDVMRANLEALALLMDPMAEQITALSQTITDTKEPLNEMADIAVSLKRQLTDMENALKNLEDGTGDMKDLIEGMADMEDDLRRMEDALDDIGGGSGSKKPESSQELVKKVKAIHHAYEQTELKQFITEMLVINGTAKTAEEAEKMAEGLAGLTSYSQEQAQAAGQLENWKTAQGLKQLHDLAKEVSFQKFCESLPGVSKSEAKQMNDLWIVYGSGKVESDTKPGAGAETGSGSSGEETGASLAAGMLSSTSGVYAGRPELSGALALYAAGIEGIELTADSDDTSPAPADGGEVPESPVAGETGGDTPAPAPGTASDENSSVGGAAIDLITSGLDSATSQMNRLERELKNTMRDIAGPTADVVEELADLCDELDDIVDLLDDAEDLSAAMRASTGKLQTILDLMDQLRGTLNDYEPKLQETLTTVSGLTSAATQTIRDTETMIGDVEDLMKSAGDDLDPGMETSLKGMIAAMRKSTKALNETDTIRDAMDTIDALVKDEWDSHTGEDNNMLLMDASAKPVSLTDPRNEGTTSIQYVMRTQEIQEENKDEEAVQTDETDEGTIWSRIADMFRDIWQAITGWF